MRKLLFFVLLLSLTACAYVDPSLTDQIVVYQNAPVRKSTMQVSLYPKGKQYRPLTAYFYPFVIQQQNTDYDHLSNAFAEIFHNAWLEERLFTISEFQPGTPYRGLQYALGQARHRGADVLVLGTVPYFYAGHTVDDTAITIKMNIYSTQTGQLIWSMVQSGKIENRFADDYIYFKHKTRMPDSPFNKIIRAIAKDMAVPLKGWLPDPDAKYQFARNAREVETQLTASPETMPEETPSMIESPMDETLPPDEPTDGGAPTQAEEAERPEVPGVNLDIRFNLDKDTIMQESLPLLDALGEALNSPELKGKRIIIAGHTDATGTADYNLKLSRQRADSVKQYLVNKWGIDPSTLEAVGYGQSRPLNEGKTREERHLNRRVEIRLAE